MIDFAIDKLNAILIKQEFYDRKKGKPTYVKKTTAYKDLINFLENYKKDFKGIDNNP